MMINVYKFFKKILIAVVAVFIATSSFAAESNLFGEIGDFGRWSTPENREIVVSNIVDELKNFGPTQTDVNNAYVPIEAKLGLAFMGGMTRVGEILDSTLVQFAIMFMLIAYAFWVAFEAYNLIGTGGDAKKIVKDIIMKGIMISVWLIVLEFGIAKTFTMIMVPIVSAGTYIATLIWESITSAAGYSLPDTCAAIKNYVATNTPDGLTITADAAAGMLCIPSQMSGFFVTIISIGWRWIISSVGVSLFSAIIGIVITWLALKNIFKYLFIALGVIADLFLALLLLPFTAIAETIAKTNYKGVAGNIFNSFLEIFKTEKLGRQITRIINAALYFVCLAVATGVSVSLLTFVIDPMTGQLNSEFGGFDGAILLILTLLLISYMADKTTSLANDWGGKIDSEFGDKVKKDAEKGWKLLQENWKKFSKIVKGK